MSAAMERGNCAVAAFTALEWFAEDRPDVVLVHGYPIGTGGDAKGIRYFHAWTELDAGGVRIVVDASNGKSIGVPLGVFYEAGQLDEAHVRRYTMAEAREWVTRTQHYGPWEPALTVPGELPAATVPDEGHLTWRSQVKQYAEKGRPGLSYEVHMVVAGTAPVVVEDPDTGEHRVGMGTYRVPVDCLLYRNRKGDLIGILNHYRDDCYEIDGMLLERAGNVNVWVRPNRRRRGIARELVAEADRRWSVDWFQQAYTEAGRRLIVRFLADRDG